MVCVVNFDVEIDCDGMKDGEGYIILIVENVSLFVWGLMLDNLDIVG